jgi:hypothetical protein
MGEQALQHQEHLRLNMYQLGKRVRALLRAISAWWASRAEADTSIDWEDGEAGKDRRH